MIILVIFIIGVASIFYKRSMPVFGVRERTLQSVQTDVCIVDVRDYNESYKGEIPQAINVPVAYLKRYVEEIPGGNVHIVANSSLERNLAVRYFRKQQLNVVSYTIVSKYVNESCCLLYESPAGP